VPGSGQPILLLADYQTTSGYPKIATVVSADLPAVGRRRPGNALRFAAVTVGAAEELCRAAEHQLAELVASLEPITQRPEIDLRSLYDGNLISGVVSGSTDTSWCPDPMRASVVDPHHAGSPAPWIPPF
jgi:hypothetical protein